MMSISVVIPTYNEEATIAGTIRSVRDNSGEAVTEILVVDAGSSDATVREAQKAGATVLQSPRKGRAAQMNYGARHTRGEVLYFLHADSHPPKDFDRAILDAIQSGRDAGCFRLSFDDSHKLLKYYAWFSRFNITAFRFGDQSLFIRRNVFLQVGGFREDHIVMEDQEIVRRIKKSHAFTVLSKVVTTSARKYREVGVLKLQTIFFLIFSLYYLGVDQQKLASLYNRWIQ